MALVSSYEGFIFDYGGVLVYHQTAEDRARLANIAGVPLSRFDELYWAKRVDYDKALLTAAEYWGDVLKQAGAKLTPRGMEELIELDITSWMQFDSLMWDWIAQLRAAGKRVAMLSNMPRELGTVLRTRTNRLNSFDYVTLSYQVRSVKPEPAIYRHCLEGLSLSPEQALFFDDKIANVRGAESLGIRAIQFTGSAQAIRAVVGG
jgi:putative hydrolase of the HAD superfamily